MGVLLAIYIDWEVLLPLVDLPRLRCATSINTEPLDLEIFCIKEEAEAKGKASTSSPQRGDHPGVRRKAILEALLQLLGTAQGGIVGDTVPSEEVAETDSEPMASRRRRGGVPARDDEQRREERAEQQAPAPQGPVLPPPPPVDYGVFMQGRCLKCGSSDHKIKDCPRLQQGAQRGAPVPAVAAAAPAIGRPGRPRAPVRVFALAREDAEQAEHVTEGTILLFGVHARVLFDMGATHSFISERFARQLALESGIESEELEVPLSVHTPAEEHYALVDCRRKKIVFRIPGDDEFSWLSQKCMACHAPDWGMADPKALPPPAKADFGSCLIKTSTLLLASLWTHSCFGVQVDRYRALEGSMVHINLSTSVGYMSHCDDALYTDGDWYNRTGMKRVVTVTAIEEANDLKKMSLEKLIGSLMAHEINMERLGESSNRKKHTNALKAAEGSSEEQSEDEASSENSEDEEAMLSRRLQRIIAKKKKDSNRRPRRFKKKAMAAAWSNISDSDNESSSSSEEEEEEANLAFMANTEEKTKLCGNKAVDIADLEKNGMHNIVAEMERMKWTEIATFSKVSYPDLVKAFYVCLRTEADGSLTSSVKDTQAKGLGIVGPEFRLKDGKLDINQMNAFNRLLHFIVCQILVPRSATFSTCTKADSDMMFWAIQNKEINMAKEEAVVATSVPLIQEESAAAADQPAAAEATTEESVVIGSLIGEIPPENILLVVGTFEELSPTTIVASILRDVLESISSTQGEPERFSESVAPEAVASGHTDEIIMEEAPSQGEQAISHVKISVEDAPIEGEQSIDEEAAPQGEHTENVSMDNEEHVGFKEPIARAHSKRKRVAHRKPKEKQLKIQWMKGEFDSVKKLISSREQSSSAPPIPPPADPVSSSGPSHARHQEEEVGPSGPSGIAEDWPSGQIVVEPAGPSGPQAVQKEPAGPSGPDEVVSGPTGPVVSEDVQSSVEELAVAPKAPEPSSLATPAPSSLPSSSIAPPAPPTFKQPMPRTISSPTPFQSPCISSPPTSQTIPPPPSILEDPPPSSSAGVSSSSGPSSTRPSSTITPRTLLHPPTPPSSITFIPEKPQLASAFHNQFEDEFKHSTLTSILAVATHFGQFHGALAILRIGHPVNCSFTVDFTILKMLDIVFLPKLHSLVLDSSAGSHAFERFARVMGRLSAQQGRLPSFQRFIFREYHLGHISSEILASLISECERLSPTDWERHYHQSALQLESMNSSLVRAGKPTISAEAFLDLNSINLVQEQYVQWAERGFIFEHFSCVVPFIGRKTWWDPGCCSLHWKEDLVGSRVLFPSLEGRPGGFQGVVPFVGRKTWWVPGCCSLRVKEDLVGSRVWFPSCEGRPAGVLGVVVSVRGTIPLLVKS
ncbi:hypothetical protein Taro_048107 [Colocasia esculenta]|uniref:CCHC-type domain-containing protein n=1 Tax=Colocasia esculenta TaxID=4460 RepID=A0A843X246_COLES|nr:hypothetical protein [Colocasia esculenta]